MNVAVSQKVPQNSVKSLDSAPNVRKAEKAAESLGLAAGAAAAIEDGATLSSIKAGAALLSQSLFSDADRIIDRTLNGCMIKHPAAQGRALDGFHNAIQNMTQDQLDEMKDTLVSRMSSPESSQWERNLLQKMYDITDAVSEHRLPPHVGDTPVFPLGPIGPLKPGPLKPEPCWPFPIDKILDAPIQKLDKPSKHEMLQTIGMDALKRKHG